MSLRRAEPRFALPRLPQRVTLLGELEEWRRGLEQAGVETVEPDEDADLVVAPTARAREAAALGPEMIILDGGGGTHTLRAAGYAVQRLVCLPNREHPNLLFCAGEPVPSRYAIRHFRRGASAHLRARNVLAAELLARGLVPPGLDVAAIASRRSGPPALLAEALRLLRLPEAHWFIQCGVFASADSRAVFYVFAPTSQEPDWVVKFARIPGLEHIFDEDERGLRLVEQLDPYVAGHAPRLIGRFETCGLHASIETAAVGEQLVDFLRSSRPREERLAALERVAEWSLEVARRTRVGGDALEPERRHLIQELTRTWNGPPIPRNLVESLRTVPTVFQHGDLWSENVLVRDSDFIVVDWEWAQERGLPLWDLLFLMIDGLARLDHVSGEARRDEYFIALCRGELSSSAILFHWLRRAVEVLSIPAEAVGPLALLLWLARAGVEDDGGVDPAAVEGWHPAEPGPYGRLCARWLTEPGLQLSWSAWRR